MSLTETIVADCHTLVADLLYYPELQKETTCLGTCLEVLSFDGESMLS